MKTPKANIEWSDVPASACIEDRGKFYIAHVGRKQAVVFWGSQDAKRAQAELWARSRDSKNQRACGTLFRQTRPLKGLKRLSIHDQQVQLADEIFNRKKRAYLSASRAQRKLASKRRRRR